MKCQADMKIREYESQKGIGYGVKEALQEMQKGYKKNITESRF